jgi:FtsX-like permease family protein
MVGVPTATLTRRWVRIESRRRWRSLALLALLVAVAGGTVLATVAGARRAASALDRLQDGARPATAVVFANSPNLDWDRVRRLPEVAALTTFVQRYAFYFDGVSHRIGLAGHSVATPLSGAFAPADDALFRTIERPVVIAGRLFDPSRDDEVVVTPGFVAHVGKGVGDTLTMTLPSPAEVRAGLDGTSANLSGPRITMRIVGVVRSPWCSDSVDSPGGAVLSPGLITQHRENTIGSRNAIANPAWVNALVRLRHGQADLPRFRNQLAATTDRADLQVWNLPQRLAQAQHEIAFEARCLLAFAGAVLIAALFVLAQAAARHTAAAVGELSALRGAGLTRGQQVVLAAAGPALAGGFGSLLGGAAAVLASRWFPIASAAYVEPRPGLALDWVVIGPGIAFFVVAAAAVAAAVAWLAARQQSVPVTAQRSVLVAAIARRGLAVPLVVGARFAFEPGRGRTAQPVRLTLVGAVAGVLGVIAALTFAAGVRDATARPERYGQTWQRGGFIGANGHDYYPAAAIASFLAKNPDLTGVGDIRESNATDTAGQGSVSLFTMARSRKPLPVIVTSGRAPEAGDEALLAPRTLDALDAHIGSRLSFTGDGGSATYRVTGVGFVPQGDPSHTYSDGGWLTPSGYRRIFASFQFHFMAIRIADGRNLGRVAAALSEQISTTFGIERAQALTFDATAPPIEILQLRQVRALPTTLGVFLALLAIAALGHALATAVRRRASEFAILRALGMTPGQCRTAVITQATVTAAVGLAVGVPVGIAVGRSVWRAVAHYTPLAYVPPAVTSVVLLSAPIALLLAGLLAALPAHRAARLSVAQLLRTE